MWRLPANNQSGSAQDHRQRAGRRGRRPWRAIPLAAAARIPARQDRGRRGRRYSRQQGQGHMQENDTYQTTERRCNTVTDVSERTAGMTCSIASGTNPARCAWIMIPAQSSREGWTAGAVPGGCRSAAGSRIQVSPGAKVTAGENFAAGSPLSLLSPVNPACLPSPGQRCYFGNISRTWA